MKKILLILMIPSFLWAQYTDDINTNRPGKTMGAYALGRKVFQLETGLSPYYDFHHTYRTESKAVQADLALRYGFLSQQFEAIAEFQYQAELYDSYRYDVEQEFRSYLKGITIGFKYLIVDPQLDAPKKADIYSWKNSQPNFWDMLKPAVSVYGGINYRTTDLFAQPEEAKITPKFMLITQNNFYQRWNLITNIYAEKLSSDYPTYGFMVTVTHGFNRNWFAFVENQTFKNDFYSDVIFRAGAAKLISEDAQFDFSISKNIKDTPNIMYASVGFSWRYDDAYNDVLKSRAVKFKKKKLKDKNKKKTEEL